MLAWVHSFDCCIGVGCGGPIQAHHLLRPWIGTRGMAMKADDRNLVPLCMHHHHELHFIFGSEEKFFDHHKGSPSYGRELAEMLWIEAIHTGVIQEHDIPDQ